MSIDAIGRSSTWSAVLDQLGSLQSSSPSQQCTSTDAVSATDAAQGPAHVSKFGQFLSKLKSLSESDPEKFKEVTSQIADTLDTAAQNATGDEKDRLTTLAERFKSASESGSADDLMPQRKTPDARTAAYEHADSGATHHAHRGGHHQPSAQMQQTWDSIFSMVDHA